MRPLPRSLMTIARNRRGLLTADELQQQRYVGRIRSEALASGFLVPVHRGVYRIASHPEDFDQRCQAALLAAPDAVISGPTAGRLWGLRKVFTDDVHVIARRTIRLDGVHSHRTDLLGRDDIGRLRGLRVLRPLRLLCDLAWHLDDAGLESVFEQMLDREMLTVPAARHAARRFAGPGRPGSVRLGRMLDGRPTWLRPADSDLELRVWRAMDAAGVRLERQVPVRLDGGRRVRLDLAETATRFAIEVDHVTWHGGRLDAQADKRRDRELTRIGWTVARVTDDDVRVRFAETIDELVAIALRLRTDHRS